MEALQSRIDSFKKSKRVKNPNKGSATITLKWPHPADFVANPECLADAGFYYSPSPEDPDNVTCFVCGKELSGWDEDDDPYELHYMKCAETCCWATVQCGLKTDVDKSGKFVFPNKSRLPTQKVMEKARLETFSIGKGWLHDKSRNHGANSRSMARAGFVCTPQEAGDDLATCVYCSVSLSGWDDDDDPMEEHRKRADKVDGGCPFFNRSDPPPTKPASRSTSQSTKPPSKAQSKPPSRSTSRTKHEDVLMPTKVFDGEEDESDSTAVKPTKESSAKTPRKPRSTSGARKSSAKTPKSNSRSTSRTTLKDVVEEEDEEDVQPPPTVKKKGRPRSKSVARSDAVVSAEEEVVTKPTTLKKTRSRSKSVAPVEPPSEEDEQPLRSSRAKSKSKSTAPIDDPPTEQEDLDVLRKSSRSRKPKQSVAAVTDEPPRKPSKTRTKPPKQEEEDEVRPVTAKAKPTKGHKRTVSRSKSKAPTPEPEPEEEQEEEPIPSPPKTTKGGSTRSKPSSRTIPAARDLFSDEVAMDDYLPPPSDATEAPPSVVEMTPLFVPKRMAKNSSQVDNARQESDSAPNPPEKEKRKPGRPSKKPTSVASGSSRAQRAQGEPSADLPPIVKTEVPEPSVAKPVPKSKTPQRSMKVVEISSDEDDEEAVEAPEEEIADENNEISEESPAKQDVFGPQAVNSNKPPSSEGPLRGHSLDGHRGHDRGHNLGPDEIPDDVAKSVVPLVPEPDIEDVPMDEPQDEQYVGSQETEGNIEMQTAPSTPPRSRTPPVQHSQPVVHTATELVRPDEPPFVPPLARLPFMPLHMLSEAELDMTVEEWIRYQIEVEQDRFKRDGERELERFKKRAEEVRNIIETM